ncbi:MAG: peptide chain release factor N(5)-glutamine methyltransferase [Candidatus Moranbacteria bacterium CG_4_10_14_3_um_filter_45_9]|nr:MAG: peptide chain release factor N(5)-glutamine methyltransferase [Candidatus Moranbacteria bacterium CG_4_10_14_3_um_filter_45_9]
MTIAELQNEFFTSGNEHITPADFFILLAHISKRERVFLLAHPEYSLSISDEAMLRDFLNRRLRYEPIASIVGHKEFYGYDFLVTRDTLIPRPETEILVELALDHIDKRQQKITIIDIGTGSGNIIISLTKEIEKNNRVSDTTYYATDISTDALTIAKENARQHGVDSLIRFYESDLLESIEKEILSTGKVIIVANLPYLSESLYKDTLPDVHNFEPKGALISDEAGLSHYYRLLRYIQKFLSSQNSLILFLEISPEQTLILKHFILTLFPDARIRIHKDLAKKNRVVEIII